MSNIRIIEQKAFPKYEDNRYIGDDMYIEAAGPSTVTKPTAGIVNGSVFAETDTGRMFIFDEDSGEWTQIGG